MSDSRTGSERSGTRPQGAAFERRFREAALRVLRRHGVAEDRLEVEIDRLRQTAPSTRLPTVKELEKTFAAGTDSRGRLARLGGSEAELKRPRRRRPSGA